MACTAIALIIGCSTAALADNEIDGCNQTCENDCSSSGADCREASGSPPKCVLGADVTCTNGGGSIELLSGNDLDLNGHSITCTETLPSACSYAAILMSSSSSKITNSSSTAATISGPFRYGVDCDGRSGSIVEKITVNGGMYGIYDCQTVRYNVVGASDYYNIYGTNWGIFTVGVSNSDSISENYVHGRIWPIFSTSTFDLDVERNVIAGTGLSAISLGYGQSSSNGTAKFNIVFGSLTSSTVITAAGTDNVDYDGNFCDPGISGCSSCITSGRCMPYTAPFTGN